MRRTSARSGRTFVTPFKVPASYRTARCSFNSAQQCDSSTRCILECVCGRPELWSRSRTFAIGAAEQSPLDCCTPRRSTGRARKGQEAMALACSGHRPSHRTLFVCLAVHRPPLHPITSIELQSRTCSSIDSWCSTSRSLSDRTTWCLSVKLLRAVASVTDSHIHAYMVLVARCMRSCVCVDGSESQCIERLARSKSHTDTPLSRASATALDCMQCRQLDPFSIDCAAEDPRLGRARLDVLWAITSSVLLLLLKWA